MNDKEQDLEIGSKKLGIPNNWNSLPLYYNDTKVLKF